MTSSGATDALSTFSQGATRKAPIAESSIPLEPVILLEAEIIHKRVMECYGEEASGVRDRTLLESALFRPLHAALYGSAHPSYQAGTLLWGLLRSHPFVQGNKRTAVAITFFFLERAGYRIEAPQESVVDLVYGVLRGSTINEVADWFRAYAVPPTPTAQD